jgi:hypothetical protein
MKTAETAPKAEKPRWHPFDCESCNATFDERTWHADYSLSGELTWSCPKCGHPNYPTIG